MRHCFSSRNHESDTARSTLHCRRSSKASINSSADLGKVEVPAEIA
jgi:hypothetical protein